uniref:Trypsin IIb3 n=1 Tax=Sesamia nonagrioides TaxID=236805 RepID=Q4L1L8_9NEOP|nr:trypsin IIb3 precursor [Sesamia nonagrioides]
MRVLALLALCFAAVAAVPSNPQRIVGGSGTTISQYPSMASLLYTWDFIGYWQNCGGIIINNRSILSAAHCTIGDPANRWRIRVGSTWANSGGVVSNVNQIINHPQFNGNTNDNDICILRSATTFSFNNNVAAASIAGSNYNVPDNQAVWAAGWGALYSGALSGSEQLQHVQTVVINQNTCRINYASRLILITDNMLCSGWPNGGRDQCQGDSGGPLYHNGIVVGVCSFGLGCAQAAFPGVNTRVSRYTAWIQSNA